MQRIVLRRGGLAILIFLTIGVAGLFGQVANVFGQVANGGFESNGGVGTSMFTSWTVADQPEGSGSWYVQTGVVSPLNSFPVPSPTEGIFAAMTDQTGPGSHILYQDIAVPATGGTLTFDIFIQNLNGAFVIPSSETLDFTVSPNQHARVDIMTTGSPEFDVGTGVLQNVYITNPGDPPTSGYNPISVCLAPFAGETVRLRFAEIDNQFFFNMGIDNVQLSAGPCETLTALSPAHLWIGLKNSDDQGTQFDLKVELLRNGTQVLASGLQRCITGVTRNPTLAKAVIVPFDPFPPETLGILALRVSTRVGTNPNDTKCAGPGGSHNNAVGLRLYYDSVSRPSHFDATITPNPNEILYLDSIRSACPNGGGESAGAQPLFLDNVAPLSSETTKCKDSGPINFNGGGPGLNPWAIIGTWSLP